MWEHNISSLHLQLCGHIWSSENVPSMFERFCAATTSGCLMLIGEWLLQFHFSHRRVQKPQQVHTEHSYLPWMDRLWVFSHVYQAPTLHLPPRTPRFQAFSTSGSWIKLPGLKSQVTRSKWVTYPGRPRFKVFCRSHLPGSGQFFCLRLPGYCSSCFHVQVNCTLAILTYASCFFLPALVFIKWCTFA